MKVENVTSVRFIGALSGIKKKILEYQVRCGTDLTRST